MYGISQLFEKHSQKVSMTHVVASTIFDSFESVGIWLLTVLCLAIVGVAVHGLTQNFPSVFYIIVTYATAMSLIISSPIHASYVDMLADELYLGRVKNVVNGLLAVSVMVIFVTIVLSATSVFVFSQIPTHQKIAFISLTTFLSLFWCINSVLSALQKERLLFFLFISGMGFFLGLFFLLQPVDTQSLIILFSIGICIPVAGGFSYVIKLYIRIRVFLDWTFLKRPGGLKPGLALLAFTLGFWSDKIVFWYVSPGSQAMDSFFRICEEYDYPFFSALCMMMIGSVMIYRGIKRHIVKPYNSFIFKLTNNFPFKDLAIEKHNLFIGISHVTSSILFIYGAIILYVLFLIYIKEIPFPWQNPFILHYLLVSTIFFSLYFFFFLIIQYLDDYSQLFRLNLLFLFLNTAGSLASIQAGEYFHGTGFLMASVICSAVGYTMVKAKVGGLEFEIFKNALQQSTKSSS